MMEEDNKKETYNADSIKVLRNLESVRQNPSMYLGNIESGEALHNCAREILDNSVDEYLAGNFCDSIEVTLYKDNSICISDNGRGIPVDIKEGEGVSALQVVMCNLSAGGKFDNKTYTISSGLHGIGASAVNAVSEWLEVEVRRDNKVWFQRYERGIPQHKVKAIGQCTRKTGTKITFKPDAEIFKHNDKFQAKKLLERIRELSYLNVGLEIIFKNEQDETQETFKDKEGLDTFIRYLRKEHQTINDTIKISHRDNAQGIAVDLVLQWTDSQSSDNVLCYSNTVRNDDFGTHYQGFRTGLNRAINKINDDKRWVRLKEGIKVEDSLNGLYAIVSVKMKGAAYASQTKSKLINSEVKAFVDFVVFEGISQFFSEHNKTAKGIIERIGLSAKAREEARKAKERVFKTSDEFSSIGILPGKLADCSSKNPDERILIITEGESATGTMKNSRDRRTTALLPLRGKILNVEKSKPEKIFDNEQIRNIFISLGITMNKSGEVNCSNIRFKTIVIATDSDVDGGSIRCLLLTLFFRFLKPVIENGYLYIAQSPLYRVLYKKERIYLKDESEFTEFKNKHNEEYSAQYFKGLGELSTEDTYDTLLDPDKRIWRKVTVKDFDEADSMLSLLMGPVVEPRAKWISENATYARNIDI